MEIRISFTNHWTSVTPEKTKFGQMFSIRTSTVDKFSNDTTDNPVEWLYQKTKIDCTKNPIGYIVPPPTKVSRNKKRHDCILAMFNKFHFRFYQFQ